MIVLLQCLPRVIERHFIAHHVHCCRNCCRSQRCRMCDHHQQSGVAAMLSHMSDELVQLVRSQDLSQLQMQDPGCMSHPNSESLWYRNLVTHDPRGCAHDAAYTPPTSQVCDMEKCQSCRYTAIGHTPLNVGTHQPHWTWHEHKVSIVTDLIALHHINLCILECEGCIILRWGTVRLCGIFASWPKLGTIDLPTILKTQCSSVLSFV